MVLRQFLLLFFFILSFVAQADYVFKDDVVVIGEEEYTIIKQLGKGGIKTTYLAEKKGTGEKVVFGISRKPSIYAHTDQKSFQAIAQSSSPHVRKEIPVRAKVKGIFGNLYVTMMEYGNMDLSKTRHYTPIGIRLLAEDGLHAIEAMEEMHLVNTDIKPANLMIMGEEVTQKAIEEGHTYLAMADHDHLVVSGKKRVLTGFKKKSHKYMLPINLTFSYDYLPPEFLINQHVIDNKSSLWQLSTSLFKVVFGREPFTLDEIEIMSQYKNLDVNRKIRALELYNDKIKMINLLFEDQMALEKNPKRIEALKDLRAIILNGLQLDPEKREYWPKGLKAIRKKITKVPSIKVATTDTLVDMPVEKLVNLSQSAPDRKKGYAPAPPNFNEEKILPQYKAQAEEIDFNAQTQPHTPTHQAQMLTPAKPVDNCYIPAGRAIKEAEKKLDEVISSNQKWFMK